MSSPETSEINSPSNSDAQTVHFGFQNTYSRLPERFYARVNPTPVSAPLLVKVNEELAGNLGIDARALRSQEGTEVLAGNRTVGGSEPLAEAYAGHQFGHFVPQLGDGRANLLGEVIGLDGIRYDIQLKGSGRTPFSRGGDGRAALGPVLREYIVSEAMAALGVPTTRALAAVTTGDRVIRERLLPGAVLTRVAASHIRVGTFEYFAARQDTDALRILADFAIARHYPEAAHAQKPYRAFLDGVITRQAQLVAQWMLIGFIHGVMNTDNTSISGETIDYGPCAFMEAYDRATVFSAIDQFGRYAYDNQPRIALWNLTRLAEALLPVLLQEEGGEQGALDSANAALAAYSEKYESAYLKGLRLKLGLTTEGNGDKELVEDLLERMSAQRADFTLTFSRLCDAAVGPEGDAEVRSLFNDASSYDLWAARWRQRLQEESSSGPERAARMRKANPVFIPRNHMVEAALGAAVERQDFKPFEQLLDVVSRPYEDRPNLERYKAPARPEEYVSQTFCGT
jgi:serine/tyrosine/threonine adenylyltransferase